MAVGRAESGAAHSIYATPAGTPSGDYFFFVFTETCGPHHQNGQGAGAAAGAQTQTGCPQAMALMTAPPATMPATMATVPPSARAGDADIGAKATPAANATAKANFRMSHLMLKD